MCLVAFQKMFRKMFSSVWLCSWKYHRKHIFYLLFTFSHIFSVAKQIYNIIYSSIQKHKQNPEKKNHQIRSNWEKKEEREALGSTMGCDRRGASRDRNRCLARSQSTLCAIAIGAVLREIAIGTKARLRSTARSFSLCEFMSHSFSLFFSLCTSVSSSLCMS